MIHKCLIMKLSVYSQYTTFHLKMKVMQPIANNSGPYFLNWLESPWVVHSIVRRIHAWNLQIKDTLLGGGKNSTDLFLVGNFPLWEVQSVFF